MTDYLISRRSLLMAGGGLAATAFAPTIVYAQDKRLLVTVVNSDPPSFNPAVVSNIEALVVATPIYSQLINLDSEGKLVPDLAEKWEVSTDGTEFTYHLRANVSWHDGKPFTSADARFTVEEMLSKLQPVGRNAYKSLKAVETPDDHTLVIKFGSPNLSFLNLPFAQGPILPKHLWEGTDFNTNPAAKAPVGTGPFRFVRHDIGSQIELERNDNYFGGAPAFDGVRFRIMPDAVSRAASFENGDLDAINVLSIPFTEIGRFKSMPNVVAKGTQIPGPVFLGIINMRNAPYSDVRVRQALAHGIDRAFIRENILPGVSHQMSGPLWPASPLYNGSLVDYGFDAERANALLDEAGFARDANGQRFRLRLMWQNVISVLASMADVITENLRPLGITVDRMPLEIAALIQRGYIGGEFDMIIGSNVLGPDPDYGVERFYNSNNILNQPFTNNSGYKNEEVDALFDKQRVTTSFEERKVIYDQIQKLIWADLPVLPICSYEAVGFENKEFVTGVYTSWNPVMENFAKAMPV